MRRRRRKSRQMKLIVIGSICILSVMTVGYAAFGTSLNISAKGNIISKSNITSDDLKNEVVTSGDGLYKDPIEEGRYIYRGANPDNYITIETINGTELYRIVAIENDGVIKILKDEKLMNEMEYDIRDGRYQSSGYCNNGQYGCNIWGSASTMLDAAGNNVITMKYNLDNGTNYELPATEASLNIYLNTEYYDTLNKKTKEIITNHIFNTGVVNYKSGQTLEMDIEQEKANKWKGKIGLINLSDYIKASRDANCINIYSAGQGTNCDNDNYMKKSYAWWTISPFSYKNSGFVWLINNTEWDGHQASVGFFVRPVVYLTSDISLSGTGTVDDPYTIN